MFKLALVFFLSFFSLTNVAFAQLGPSVPTVTTTPTTATPQPALPQVVKYEPVNFFGGGWVLAFYNGSRVTVGSTMTIPYSEMRVTFHGGQVNSDGSRYWFGTVDGEYGSAVTVFNNSNIDRMYFTVSVYVPDMEFGTSNQYTSTECRVFLAPRGNDYLHGTMSAMQQSSNWDGNWVTRSLFSGQVDIYHIQQSTTVPVVGGKG